MSKSTKSTARDFRSLEAWDTRFGTSVRVVTRDERGRLVDNVSLAAVLKAV
jgi:hypothetical protein